MKREIPRCMCGGQAVIYEVSDIVVIKCSKCSQFVTEHGKEQAIEEWKVRMHGTKRNPEEK